MASSAVTTEPVTASGAGGGAGVTDATNNAAAVAAPAPSAAAASTASTTKTGTGTQCDSNKWGFPVEKYSEAVKMWPEEGRHVLASFDDDAVVVYQAFNKEIGEYAAKHNKFDGAPGYTSRTTWIKTNFAWMMYRCDRGDKDKNQSDVLRIRLKRSFFDDILAEASKTKKGTSVVRLQWDPDHLPVPPYTSQRRRAVQLGLKGDWQRRLASGEGVLDIVNLSEFLADATTQELVPVERVYPVNAAGRAAIEPSD